MKHPKHKWVVIFLVYAELQDKENNIKDFIEGASLNKKRQADPVLKELENLFEDIRNSPASKHTDVYLLYNSVRTDSVPPNDTTYLFKAIGKDGIKHFKEIKRATVQDFVQKPETLIQMFRIIDKKGYKKKMLITWDHGSIFGIFKKRIRDKAILHFEEAEIDGQTFCIKRNQPYVKFVAESSMYKRMPVMSNKCQDVASDPAPATIRDILTNEELSEAIKEGLRKVDILVMYNCSMMNLNTTFALRSNKCVDYFIAPQAGIDPPSYNYKEILKYACLHPEITPLKLSRICVNTLNKMRLKRDLPDLPAIKNWSVLCLKVRHLDKVIFLLEKVTEQLDRLIETPSLKVELRDIRNSLFPFDAQTGTSLYMVDLRSLLHKLSIHVKTTSIFSPLYEQLENILQDMLVEKFIGCNLYLSIPHNDFTDNAEPSGLSIYFPRNLTSDLKKEIFQTFIAENAEHQSAFFSETKWLSFVCRFIET